MRLSLQLLLLGLASWTASGCAPRRVAPLPPALGCYRADRLLGYSASGAPEGGDSAWRYFRLAADSQVMRPALVSARLWTRSGWAVRGDTLHVRLFTGLNGWDLALVGATAGRYVGRAKYLSDAVVRGAAPLYVPVQVRLAPCPVALPT